jgi:hypothetical protein
MLDKDHQELPKAPLYMHYTDPSFLKNCQATNHPNLWHCQNVYLRIMNTYGYGLIGKSKIVAREKKASE